MNKSSKLDSIIISLMIIALISTVIIIILYVFIYNNKYLITSITSLFIVGVSIITVVLKDQTNEESILDKYVILTKEEYEYMKNTLYKQEREIKKLRSTK